MKVEGTTATSTEAQRATENTIAETAARTAAGLAAADTQLIADALEAAKVANESAGQFMSDVIVLAHRIDALHANETWKRQVSPETGELFTSPVAYYRHLFTSGAFVKLEKALREQLVGALVDPENAELRVGVNELAALTGVHGSTISRDGAPVIEAAKENVEAREKEAALEEELDACAADFTAQAIANGADEADAAYIGEAARAALKKEKEDQAAEAAAETAAQETADEEAAEVAATDKCVKMFGTAAANLLARDHLLTEAQRETVRDTIDGVIEKFDALEAMIAKAAADREKAAAAAKKAAADVAARNARKAAPAADGPKPGAARGGRKAATA